MVLSSPVSLTATVHYQYIGHPPLRGYLALAQVPALTVFEWGRDMWQPITAFQPDEVSYLERRGRLGARLWVRPDA